MLQKQNGLTDRSFFSTSIFLFQTFHFTQQSGKALDRRNVDASPVGVIPHTKSLVEARDKHTFLRVWNKGTKDYTPQIQRLMDGIPWQELLNRHVSEALASGMDDKRGNLQFNYGFASGQSYQPRHRENILEHFGTAVPSVLNGTADFLPVIHQFEKIAKVVGMRSANPEFLRRNPGLDEEIRFTNTEFGSCLALTTLAFQKLDTKACVSKHVDSQNSHGPLAQVITCSKILQHPFDGR